MATKLLDELLKQTEQLSLEEQLTLVAQIAERARKRMIEQQPLEPKHSYKWLDAAGLVKEPFFREDAQDWVTRARQEGDEQRKSVHQ